MTDVGTVAWFGDRAVLVTVASGTSPASVARALAVAVPDLLVRVGMRSTLVESSQPDPHLLDIVSAAVAGIDPTAADRGGPPHVVSVPVVYDGTDLAEVAHSLGMPADDVAAAHREQAWEVAMVGFAPGFGYLVPRGEPMVDWARLPRRDRPRERVPAGSVAVAAGMSAVYPTAMPGGWHLIGRTGAVMFDPAAAGSPALLHPGDVVRFVDEAS